MKLKDKRSLIIVVLMITLVVIGVVTIFNDVKEQRYQIEQKNFLSNITNFQIKLSFYLGSMSKDTFGVYTNEEIILGKKLDDENSDKKDITPIVDSSKKVEIDGKNAFEINYENIKKALDVDVKVYEGMKFYIQDGSVIKVKFDKFPNWWTSAMDIYKL